MNRRINDIVGDFNKDGRKAVAIFADEVGSAEWTQAGRTGSKVDLIRARQADLEVRNVRLEAGQKVDIEAVTNGNFTMTDVWVTR